MSARQLKLPAHDKRLVRDALSRSRRQSREWRVATDTRCEDTYAAATTPSAAAELDQQLRAETDSMLSRKLLNTSVSTLAPYPHTALKSVLYVHPEDWAGCDTDDTSCAFGKLRSSSSNAAQRMRSAAMARKQRDGTGSCHSGIALLAPSDPRYSIAEYEQYKLAPQSTSSKFWPAESSNAHSTVEHDPVALSQVSQKQVPVQMSDDDVTTEFPSRLVETRNCGDTCAVLLF